MLAKLQSYVSAEFTGFMFSLEPVFTAIFAMIIFGESLQIKGYFGAILILIGVLLASSKKANISDKEQESSTSCAY
ncbi:MAG: DMT family transporter [Streptococcus hyointestinalis]|nr:DMT family transporter [Streptococcus hyointestinalis]MDD6384804.1 DMT family transporter [Streptococcus hyointestinalis]